MSQVLDMGSAEQCMEAIARGGQARSHGVKWLYEQYRPKFRLYFLKNRVPESEAEDVVQDTFVNIVRFCADFRSEADVAVWMWKVARNAMISHFRKVGRKPVLVDVDSHEAGRSDATHTRDDVGGLDECVRNAFARFSAQEPERASALRLVAIEGWSSKELAAHLERSPGATREYVSQCRKVFRPFVQPCHEYLTP